MPDMIGTPVGAMIQPPDPMQGVRTLSGIIGIQQQKQNLQTGQYRQQEAAATAQQQGLAAQQAQGVQNFFKTWDPSQHVLNDGTTDLDSALQSDEFKSSGNAKPAVMQALLDIKNKQLTNKTALAGLNSSLVTQLGQQSGALAVDADVKADAPDKTTGVNAGRAKVKEMFANFAQQSPDAARIAAIYSPLVDHAPPKKLAAAIGALQMQARDVGGQQSVQLPRPVQTNAGLVNQNPLTGDIASPRQVSNAPNAPPRTPAPGASPAAPAAPSGAPGLGLNPTPVQIAAASARATGAGNADINTSNMVVDAQREARNNIDITKRIDQLADVVDPGSVPEKVSQGLGALGLQNVNQARSELVKDLGRLRGNFSLRAGSDQRAATVLEGLPTDVTPTQTIHQAMDMTRGTERQTLALGQLQAKSSKSTQGQMNGFQGDYSHAVGAVSPLMHEYLSLTPAEQVGFFKRNFATKEQARAFRDQANSAKKLSPDAIGQ